MPYKVVKSGDMFNVMNTETDKMVPGGDHTTRADAMSHMRALYANVKTKQMDPYDIYGAQYTQTEANYNPVGGDGTQACSNCRWFSSPDGCLLVSGDIAPNGVSDMWDTMPVYNPQPIPVQIVKEADMAESIFERVKEWAVGLLRREAPVHVDYSSGRAITLIPEGDRLRYIMPYTNNFQDRHTEIFAKHAHKEFEKWADENEQYPEAWMWHVPGTRWGKADYVTVDDTGFGIVSGLVDVGMEHIVKSMADDPDLGVSHSCWAIQADNSNVIDRYYTYETSPLPQSRAANQLHTGEVRMLEDNMALDPTKRAWLIQHAGEDYVKNLEKDFESRAQAATAQGIASREAPIEPTPVEAPTATPALTLDDLTTALQAVTNPLVAQITTLTGEVTELKSKQKSIDERAEEIFGARTLPEGYVASKEAGHTPAGGENTSPGFEWLQEAKGALSLTGAD